jgi:CRISPR-associated DxTHG motif protein
VFFVTHGISYMTAAAVEVVEVEVAEVVILEV